MVKKEKVWKRELGYFLKVAHSGLGRIERDLDNMEDEIEWLK